MSTKENQAQQGEQEEVQAYFFHSTPERQKTYRQYSAGGYVARSIDTKQPYICISYAVCSERDKFSKEKARLITTGRLMKGQKIHRLPITEEEYQHPARTLRDMAIKYVPASTLPKSRHAGFVDEHNSHQTDSTTLVKRAAEVLVQVPTEEELLEQTKIQFSELQSSVNLGSLLNQTQAEA